MIKLDAIHCPKIWGYEDWIASTYIDGCQKEFLDFVKADYPLIVKVIKADSTLSVQVHPDDKDAEELEGKGIRGKTECWYILDATPDAKLVYGLKPDATCQKIADDIKSGTLEKDLHFVNVKKGDFIFIPSGTVHAIGGGIKLLEIQQSSNVTYRLYDWNRGRELHVEKSLKVLSSKSMSKMLPEIQHFDKSFTCKYFALELLSGTNLKADETTLLFLLEGNNVNVESSDGTKLVVEKENIIAVKAGEELKFSGNGTFMKIVAK